MVEGKEFREPGQLECQKTHVIYFYISWDPQKTLQRGCTHLLLSLSPLLLQFPPLSHPIDLPPLFHFPFLFLLLHQPIPHLFYPHFPINLPYLCQSSPYFSPPLIYQSTHLFCAAVLLYQSPPPLIYQPAALFPPLSPNHPIPHYQNYFHLGIARTVEPPHSTP